MFNLDWMSKIAGTDIHIDAEITNPVGYDIQSRLLEYMLVTNWLCPIIHLCIAITRMQFRLLGMKFSWAEKTH